MKKNPLNKLTDADLSYVSGGKEVTTIEGFSYSIVKLDDNWIFKWGVKRGDGRLLSTHISQGFAQDAAADYRVDEFKNQVARYERYNNSIIKHMDK